MHVPLSAALSLMLAGSAGSASGAPRDAVAADPTHHRTVFENDHVRVNELLASPGSESPMHSQPPAVLISLDRARFETVAADGTVSLVDHHPGEVSWIGAGAERGWTLLAGQAHAFLVEVKAAADGRAPAPAALGPGDSVTVDPAHHHAIMENEYVRVVDGMASPGATSPRHSHPPSVLVSLAKARFRVDIDGRTHLFDFNPARVYWIDAFEHAWEVLSGEARVIVVEVKSARGKTEP